MCLLSASLNLFLLTFEEVKGWYLVDFYGFTFFAGVLTFCLDSAFSFPFDAAFLVVFVVGCGASIATEDATGSVTLSLSSFENTSVSGTKLGSLAAPPTLSLLHDDLL